MNCKLKESIEMSTVAYIHGFGSDGKDTTEKLSATGLRVHRIQYNTEDADLGFDQIDHQILEMFQYDTDVVLVGGSLGGFWANFFAERYDLKCVLMNPVPKPSVSLQKYISLSQALTFAKYEGPVKTDTFRTTLIGLKDTVLNPFEVIQHYNKGHAIYFEEEGHRFTDFTPVINTIIRTINQVNG